MGLVVSPRSPETKSLFTVSWPLLTISVIFGWLCVNYHDLGEIHANPCTKGRKLINWLHFGQKMCEELASAIRIQLLTYQLWHKYVTTRNECHFWPIFLDIQILWCQSGHVILDNFRLFFIISDNIEPNSKLNIENPFLNQILNPILNPIIEPYIESQY